MLISVIIPTKNRMKFLKRALNGFQNKINHELEVIVVDDNSDNKEENKKLCQSFKCKYICNESSLGAPKARNIGLNHAKGKYIWFFDDDDYVDENILDDLIHNWNKKKYKNMCLLGMNIIKNEKSIKKVIPIAEKNTFEEYRKNGQQVNTSCCIFSKKLLEEINGWSEELVSGQDTDLFLRASQNINIEILEGFFVNIETESNDRITKNPKKQQIGKIQFLTKNWRIIHFKRKIYYILTFVFFVPYLKFILNKILGSVRK